MAEIERQEPIFEYTGKRLCLDFTNTVEDRMTDPRELLQSYNDLLLWGQQGQLLTNEETSRLREEAVHHRKEAEGVLQRATNLREAMYRILVAAAEESSPAQDDLLTLNAEVARTMSQACIVPAEDGFAWDWQHKEQALDCVLWPVVRSASALLTSEHLADVRVCAADDCGWLFLDTSKNHSRRWCDMKSCGNRAKARKHYTQKKQSS